MKKYLVGGFVRDSLINSNNEYVSVPNPNDRDYVVVGATYEEMCDMYGETIGKDFPVWINEDGDEIALARQERSIGSGYTDFVCTTEGVTLEDDLGRRDITINAMAVPATGGYLLCNSDVIDPYGGLDDLKKKIIRHTTSAFAEDPLRVLRVARFYARYAHIGFTVAEETKELCRSMVKDSMLKSLPIERIWAETYKALQTHSPELYFIFLGEIGFGPTPTVKERWALKGNRFKCPETEDEMRILWASFDSMCRFKSTYGAPKKFDKISFAVMEMNHLDLRGNPLYFVDAITRLGGYKDSLQFVLATKALLSHQPITFIKILEKIVEESRDIKVDCPQGPQYGEMLRQARFEIANRIIRCQM